MKNQKQIDYILSLQHIRIPKEARLSDLSKSFQVTFAVIYELCKQGEHEISNDTISEIAGYKGFEMSSKVVTEIENKGLITTKIIKNRRNIFLNDIV